MCNICIDSRNSGFESLTAYPKGIWRIPRLLPISHLENHLTNTLQSAIIYESYQTRSPLSLPASWRTVSIRKQKCLKEFKTVTALVHFTFWIMCDLKSMYRRKFLKCLLNMCFKYLHFSDQGIISLTFVWYWCLLV